MPAQKMSVFMPDDKGKFIVIGELIHQSFCKHDAPSGKTECLKFVSVQQIDGSARLAFHDRLNPGCNPFRSFPVFHILQTDFQFVDFRKIRRINFFQLVIRQDQKTFPQMIWNFRAFFKWMLLQIVYQSFPVDGKPVEIHLDGVDFFKYRRFRL